MAEVPEYPSTRASFADRHAQYDDVEQARVRLADVTRRIIDEQASTAAGVDDIDRAAALVAEAAALLARREHGRPYAGTAEGSLRATGPRAFIDFSPFAGALNPLAPPLTVAFDGDTVTAIASFGLAYEGPPGCLHGGFVAAVLDEMLGYAQSLSGNPGMTGRLTVSYRSPTPLHRELVCRARYVRSEGRKVFAEATLHAGDTLCAEAEGLFVSMKPEVWERLFAERGGGSVSPA